MLPSPSGCERLQVIPASAEDISSQICRLGPEVMKILNIRIGDPVWILGVKSCNHGNRRVLCTVWPKTSNGARYIQPSTLVFTVGFDSFQLDKFVAMGDIEVIGGVEYIIDIGVQVILADHRKVVDSEHSKALLGQTVRHCIRGLTVSKDCIVNCFQTEAGKLMGITHVIVNHFEVGNSSGKSCGKVTAETRINVLAVMSSERYEQRKVAIADKKGHRLGGLNKELHILEEFVKLPQLLTGEKSRISRNLPRGVLLQGPPGCGKTSLVHQLAKECDTYIMTVNSSELCGDRPGETEENLESVWEKVRTMTREGPCVLFLDDVDALCPAARVRQGAIGDRRVITKLVNVIDRLHDLEGVTIIAATSNMSDVDPMLKRSGRLAKQVLIGIPSMAKRADILTALTANIPVGPEVSLSHLAECTPGYVGADLESLVRNAQYRALQKYQVRSSQSEPEQICVGVDDFEEALHSVRPSTQQGSDIVVDHKPLSWDDIGGLDEVKLNLQQAIEWPLRYPQSFARLGITRPKGVLLYGPPGCAKTTLVRAAATSCHVTFLSISGGQLYSPYVGDSERKLTQVFQQARAGAPSILFIDELDSVVGGRDRDSKGVKERVLSTLLNEMDGIGVKLDDVATSSTKVAEGQAILQHSEEENWTVDNNGVLVVAATNRPDMLDDALLRPGRLDRIIYVPPPDLKARRSILEVHTRKIPLEHMTLEKVARDTEGFTGADLENLVREVVLHAMTQHGVNTTSVLPEHFDQVLRKLEPSLTASQLQSYSHLKGKYGTKTSS